MMVYIKHIQYLVIFTLLLLTASFGEQSKKYVGTYIDKVKTDEGVVMEYELQLLKDGTFTFKFYENQLFFENTKKGQGTWIDRGDDIAFTTSKEQLTEEFVINFTGTKAYVDGKILTFYETELDLIAEISLKR